MELFPDQAHVRLRSRVRGSFLHADQDGVGVSLSARRASLNTAWQVHREQRDGNDYVLLHSAAYGRYLALTPQLAPPGHLGIRAVQNDYDNPLQVDIAWQAIVVGEHFVLIRHPISNRLLRANGRYRVWNNGVSGDFNNKSTMMLWRVEAIPPMMAPPALPLPPRVPEILLRTIVYERPDNQAGYLPPALETLWVISRSVHELRMEMANELQVGPLAITLCVRAGEYGRPVPLITDLPRNEAPLFVVVLTTGSPAAQALVYPDLDAQ